MRGINISNIYIIENKRFSAKDLKSNQIKYINNIRNLERYNMFRNDIINTFGDNITATIEIKIPENIFSAFNKRKIRIL